MKDRNSTVALASAVALLALSGTLVYANGGSQDSATNVFKPAEVANGVVENTDATVFETVTSQAYELTTATDNTSVLSVAKPVQLLNVDAKNQTNADAFVRATIVPMWVSDSASDSFVVGAVSGIVDASDNAKLYEGTETSVAEDKTYSYPVQSTYQGGDDHEYLDVASFGDLKGVTVDEDGTFKRGDDAIGTAANSFKLGDVTFTLDKDWQAYWFLDSKDGYFYYRYVLKVGQKTEPLLESVSVDYGEYYRYGGEPITLRVDVLSDSVQAMGEAVNELWTNVEKSYNEEAEEEHPYGYVLSERQDKTEGKGDSDGEQEETKEGQEGGDGGQEPEQPAGE